MVLDKHAFVYVVKKVRSQVLNVYILAIHAGSLHCYVFPFVRVSLSRSCAHLNKLPRIIVHQVANYPSIYKCIKNR